MLTRCLASVWKSAYGLSSAARLTVAPLLRADRGEVGLRCLTRVGGEDVAGHAGHDQREDAEQDERADAARVAIADGRGAPDAFCDERSRA